MTPSSRSAVIFFYVNKLGVTEVPAGFLDRVVSWLLALGVALVGARRSRG